MCNLKTTCLRNLRDRCTNNILFVYKITVRSILDHIQITLEIDWCMARSAEAVPTNGNSVLFQWCKSLIFNFNRCLDHHIRFGNAILLQQRRSYANPK